MQARHEDAAAEERGEIGPMRQRAALQEATAASRQHKAQQRVDVAAAKRGDANAQYNIAVHLLSSRRRQGRGPDGTDVRRAVRWFEVAAARGHRRALYNLGVCRLHGIGTPQVC